MKRIILMLIVACTVLTSCDNYETYADKKDKERNAISAFISKKQIKVISEQKFQAQDCTTDTTINEYVYMNNTGVYMQITRKGCGRPLLDGENATLKVRFTETSIFNTNSYLTNADEAYNLDYMSISRTGSNYTASFTSGFMASTYGASVPSGWLVPFKYIKLDGPTATEDIAKVRLIVPHTQGHSTASGNVYPYFYEITFQR